MVLPKNPNYKDMIVDKSRLLQEFHECLASKKCKYAGGCIEIDDFSPEEQELLIVLRDQINANLNKANNQFILESGENPILYFDYYKVTTLLNAGAYMCGNRAFIAFTYQLVLHIYTLGKRASNFTSPFDSLEKLRNASLEFPLILSAITWLYIVGHELGHHIHGHTRKVGDGFASTLFIDDEQEEHAKDILYKHALEIEADCYASTFCRINIPSVKALKDLNQEALDDLIVSGIVLYRVFRMKFNDKNELRGSNYPASYIRTCYMLSDLSEDGMTPALRAKAIKAAEWSHSILEISDDMHWQNFNFNEDEWTDYCGKINAFRSHLREDFACRSWSKV